MAETVYFYGLTQGILPTPGAKRTVSHRHKQGLTPVATVFKVTQVSMEFASAVSGTSGVGANGFVVEINGAPVAISGVSQGSTFNITVAHALAIVGDDAEVIYDGTGDWISDSGRPLSAFNVVGVVE